MNRCGSVWPRFRFGCAVLCSKGFATKCGVFHRHRHFSSLTDAIIDPKKGSISANVNIVNYSLAGAYIVSYSENGFMLSNGTIIRGPMVSFPQNAFSWRINSAEDINEDSLSLFRVLCPELEILVIGKGAVSEKINQREIMNMCWKYNLGVEVLSTSLAVGTFNFLNFEGRYVAAALIPPICMDVYDERKRLKQLEAARDIQLSIEEKPKIKKLPTPESPTFLKRLVHPLDKDKQ
ncbi:NADH dehydrogenase ubiquinone 1 alpha subcomplex assembly factor 3 [Taenia crassiceps]|uniref:NADH dehydrogenase [ubiquinone] 1 alpha subcomplex assembly factor 3 n=1 Tax=Taenia crassiceps TaxID=6207 RepID=A0ABR4Q2J2_9CEST